MAGTSRKRRWYSHARRALPTGAANHPRAIGTGPANFRPQQTGRSRFSRLQHLGRRWSLRIAEKVGGIGFTALDQLDQLPAGERAADRAGVRGHPNREGLQAGESAGALCSYRGRMLSTSGALQPLAARPRPGCGSPRRAWGAQIPPETAAFAQAAEFVHPTGQEDLRFGSAQLPRKSVPSIRLPVKYAPASAARLARRDRRRRSPAPGCARRAS